MDVTQPPTPKRVAKQASLSLFPEHDAVIVAFAADDNRSYSNAAQTIIERWAVANGYAHLLATQEQPA